MKSRFAGARPASLVLRLTFLIGLVITVIFLTVGLIIERSIDRHFAEQDAGELDAVVKALRQQLSTAADGVNSLSPQDFSQIVSGHHGVFFNVTDSAGQQRYASPGADLSPLTSQLPPASAVSVSTLRSWEANGQHYRGTTVLLRAGPLPSQEVRARVAINMDFHLLYLQGFRANLWLTTVVASIAAIFSTWIAAYYGLAPIRRISAEMRGIKSDRLDVRLKPEAVPIELAELAMSFNDMLERIGDGFRRLSNFSADIAHELRTPITNLTTQTHVALSQARTTEEYREILYSSQEELDRMSKMVGDMLFIARADNKQLSYETEDLEVGAEVRALFEFFEAFAEERGVNLVVEGGPAIVRANQSMMRRALSNLLSNAIRRTPSNHTVIVRLGAGDGLVSIRVCNPGRPIEPEHLPKLFDRFYRVDPSRQRNGDGAGLGLAIVKSIVDAHGGSVSASSSKGEVIFTMNFPASLHQGIDTKA